MHRFSLSILFGFILIWLQSLLIMKWNGYTTIQFNSLSSIFLLWMTNFFIIYSLFSTWKSPIRTNSDL